MDFSDLVSEVRLSYILDFVFRLEYIWIDNTNYGVVWCGHAIHHRSPLFVFQSVGDN